VRLLVDRKPPSKTLIKILYPADLGRPVKVLGPLTRVWKKMIGIRISI